MIPTTTATQPAILSHRAQNLTTSEEVASLLGGEGTTSCLSCLTVSSLPSTYLSMIDSSGPRDSIGCASAILARLLVVFGENRSTDWCRVFEQPVNRQR